SPETITIAFGGGQRGIETYADHVDDLVLLEHRHAGETDVREEAADVSVDIVLDQQLLDLAAADIGLGLVVNSHDLDRPTVDAAVLVDAVDSHLQADQRGLAAKRARARQGLFRADLERLGLAEGFAPWRRHQHHCADRAAAPTDDPPPRDFAAVPEVLPPFFFFPFLSHYESSL